MRSTFRACLSAAVAALCVPAMAQPPAAGPSSASSAPAEGSTLSGRDEAWRISLAPRGEYTFSGDLRSSDARVSIGRVGLALDVSGPLGDRARLNLNADLEASFYRFKDTTLPLPSGAEPLRDAYTLRLRPGIVHRLDDEWSLLGGAIVEFSGESGADVGKSVTFGGYGGASYRVSEDLTLTFGIIVKSRLEDDVFVAPLLGVRWKIDDRFSVNTEGLGIRLSAKVDTHWTASIFGRFEMRDYRLDDDAVIPGGIVQDTRVPLGAAIEWSPTPTLTIALSGGVVVAQKYHFLNRNGDELSGDKTRPAPFVGLRGEWKF